MVTVPVTQSTGSIARFLKHIQDAGIPTKVTNPYLKSVGFTSSNDSALVPIFKSLKFIDAAGTPTDRWKSFRNTESAKSILADAIREAYSGLFDIFPDAERKDDEAVANWLRGNTEHAGITITRAVRTFKALCAEANFVDAPSSTVTTPTPTQSPIVGEAPQQFNLRSTAHSPSVNINIELQLPSTNDPEVYENFFKAMKKNLFEEIK